MKKHITEYDFRSGVRGKYFERYQASKVAVQLDPDLAQTFPDSASVNKALRALLLTQKETPGRG